MGSEELVLFGSTILVQHEEECLALYREKKYLVDFSPSSIYLALDLICHFSDRSVSSSCSCSLRLSAESWRSVRTGFLAILLLIAVNLL